MLGGRTRGGAVVRLLPREGQEFTRLDGPRLAAVGAVRLVGAEFADVDVSHDPMIAPTPDIGGVPRRWAGEG